MKIDKITLALIAFQSICVGLAAAIMVWLAQH
jgi:hypothetical protein